MRHSSLTLNSSTLMGKEENKKLTQLIQGLLDNSDSYEFRQPVDHKTLGLADYLTIVKHPMDLTTVKKKLLANCYSTVEQCLDQIQVIWDNCKIYNPKATWIHGQADKLEKVFKKMIKNYLPFIANFKKEDKKKEQKKVVIKIPQPQMIPEPEPKVEPIIPIVETEEQRLIFGPRRRFIEKASLCTPQHLGILFLLIYQNQPNAVVMINGTAKIQAELIQEALLNRLNNQIDIWGDGLQIQTKKK